MAGLLSKANLARIAKIVALLLFLLPWVTVSCSPQALGSSGLAPPSMSPGTGDLVLIQATGAQLAAGTATPNNPDPSARVQSNPFSTPNYAILGALLLILLSLAATFVLKGRRGTTLAAAGCALAAAAIGYAVLVDIPALVHASFASSGGAAGASGMPPVSPAELAQLIKVRAETGFWLTLAALAAAVVLNVLAIRKPSGPATQPPPTP